MGLSDERFDLTGPVSVADTSPPLTSERPRTLPPDAASAAGERPRTLPPDAARPPISRAAELLSTDARFASLIVTRPHPLIVMVRRDEALVFVAPSELWDRGRDLLRPYATKLAEGEAAIVLIGRPRSADLAQAVTRGVVALVDDELRPDDLFVALHTSLALVETRARAESRGKWVNRYRYELGELIEIARAITTERDVDKLLGLILEKGRFITGADAGSIYVVEGTDRDPSRRSLRFKLSQNDSVQFDAREFTVPMRATSIAGAAALSGKTVNIADVNALPPGAGLSFDRRFDDKIGYHTRSMLVAPLVDKQGDVIGVVQLINKKRDPAATLSGVPDDDDAQVIAFDERSEQLLSTLAAQAGIALENALLYAEIRSLFEGFVAASVAAIEQRDPTTSGHSRRVADLTVALARAVERESTGPYRDVLWSAQDVREIEYASLLHDFGKIGVREEVLIKAKKLYPAQTDAIRARFDFALRTVEVEALREKVALLERRAPLSELAAVDEMCAARRARLDEAWHSVVVANEPTVMKGGDFALLDGIARETFVDIGGEPRPLLTPAEVQSLSVPRGSLTGNEIEAIRSHVLHTYNFLRAIPWGRSLDKVPIIAGAHHERLNGTGYPHGLRAEEIPLQSKMMSVTDIFDALTASDRPYKKAIPVDRALDILALEVKDQSLDGELVRIFREARPWEGVVK